MSVKQISITLDNAPGQFLQVSEYLGTEGINIRAISVADTSDISTVRFVTDDPEKTINVLKSHGYSVRERDVIAVEIPDHPGALQAVLKPLSSIWAFLTLALIFLRSRLNICWMKPASLLEVKFGSRRFR